LYDAKRAQQDGGRATARSNAFSTFSRPFFDSSRWDGHAGAGFAEPINGGTAVLPDPARKRSNMFFTKSALAGALALGLLGGCGSFTASVGEPDQYYAVGYYDGPDYLYVHDGHYYYDYHHRDDGWRHAHESERIRLDRDTRDRFARERGTERAEHASHVEHDDHRDHDDHH
jgi:hypothetical protein